MVAKEFQLLWVHQLPIHTLGTTMHVLQESSGEGVNFVPYRSVGATYHDLGTGVDWWTYWGTYGSIWGGL